MKQDLNYPGLFTRQEREKMSPAELEQEKFFYALYCLIRALLFFALLIYVVYQIACHGFPDF